MNSSSPMPLPARAVPSSPTFWGAAATRHVLRIAIALLLCAGPVGVWGPGRAAAADAAKSAAGDPRECKREPASPEARKFKGCLSTTVFVASGGGDGLVVTGTVANPARPFTLRGTFPGGVSVHKYTPTNAGGGTSTYALSGSGVTGTGRGTYTLSRQGGNWALVDTTNGCVNGIPGSCRTKTAHITLTARSL